MLSHSFELLAALLAPVILAFHAIRRNLHVNRASNCAHAFVHLTIWDCEDRI